MNTHITFVCDKECSYIYNFIHLINFKIDISNYPIDPNSLFCTDILIFQYSKEYDECLSEIARAHELHQHKQIIIVSNHFDSKCISWAITNKINGVIFFPDELTTLNNILSTLIKDPYQIYGYETDYRSTLIESYNAGSLNQKNNIKTKPAINFIHHNYSRKVLVKNVASLCNMAVSTFTRVFKQEQGITFCQYLNSLRVCAAKKLLRDTNQPISQIAYLCGFNDAAYFTRQFKSSENKTPKEYRNILQ